MAEHTFEAEDMTDLVGYFAERVNLVFAYFYCVIMFEGDEDFTANAFNNGRAWGLQTIHGACLHTTLTALRDLDDVMGLRTSRTRNDDIRLSDFGYPTGLSFLSASERDRINKEIIHATLPGAQGTSGRWDIFELATKGIQQSITFMKWVETHFASDNPSLTLSTIYVRTRTEKTYEYFVKACEGRTKKISTDETRKA
jgi:hypothetical protein